LSGFGNPGSHSKLIRSRSTTKARFWTWGMDGADVLAEDADRHQLHRTEKEDADDERRRAG